MTRDFQNLEVHPQKVARSRGPNQEIGLHRLNFEAETEVAKEIPLGNHRRALRMDPDRTPKSLLAPGQILDVIDVPVGKAKEPQVDSFAHQPVAGTIGRVEKD